MKWTHILLVIFALDVMGALAGGGWRSWRKKWHHDSSEEEDCPEDELANHWDHKVKEAEKLKEDHHTEDLKEIFTDFENDHGNVIADHLKKIFHPDHEESIEPHHADLITNHDDYIKEHHNDFFKDHKKDKFEKKHDKAHGKGHHKGQGRGHGHGDWHWTHGAGLIMLIIITVALAILLTMVTCLFCKNYRRHRAGKWNDAKAKRDLSTFPPAWSNKLVVKPELSAGFGLLTDGLARVDSTRLIRKRQGSGTTDGATWSVPLKNGKHVFEITWPSNHRGPHDSVGLGTSEAPIKAKGSHALVGSNDQSWGLDISDRKVRHANKVVMSCPTDGTPIPDKFLMYVDMDAGKLGFGNEIVYWGDVISNLPKQEETPLHVMIGTARSEAELAVQYIGSASTEAVSLCDPPKYNEVQETAGPIPEKTGVPEDIATPQENPTSQPPPPYIPPPAAAGDTEVV